MAELADLIRARGYSKRRLTTIANFLKGFKDSENINQLKTRIPILEGIFKDFHQHQFDIINKIDETPDEDERNKLLDSHDKVTESFETEYFNVLSEIQTKIEAGQLTISTNNSNHSSSSNSVNKHGNSKTHIELPRYELPNFAGDLSKFMAFHDSFESLIHNNPELNDIQKFHFLKSCLKGDAARVIESFVLSSANYEAAWQAVIKRYKNDRLIIQQHVLNIFKSADITKSSPSAIRQLLDDLTINMSALKVLGVDTNSWYVFLIPIFAEKLDYASKKEWQALLTSEVPKLAEFIEFLEKRFQILESVQPLSNRSVNDTKQSTSTSKRQLKTSNVEKSHVHVATGNKKFYCFFCKKGGHTIYQCKGFLRLSVPDRIKETQNLGLCANCLNEHTSVECRSTLKCKLCHNSHNTLLHSADEIRDKPLCEPSSTVFCAQLESESVLLSTAVVLLKNAKNQVQECRVLLDQGSQSNFITRKMFEQLGISSQNINIVVNGISGATSYINKTASVILKSRLSDFKTEIKCLIVPKITNDLPNFKVKLEHLEIPKNIRLADPQFGNPGPIDMLIGAQLFWKILCSGNVYFNNDGPYFQETHLGWIVGGTVCSTGNKTLLSTACNLSTRLEEQVERFWKLEEVQGHKPLSADERFCENHFIDTIKRDTDGRFVAELPFRNNFVDLGTSRDAAIKRYYSLENKLGKNPTLKLEYSKFMKEYLDLEHMEKVPTIEINEGHACYLPHHAVLKQESLTTKLRVVFDASCKTSNGKSLNDNLLAGPVIQQELFMILLRFRTFKYTLNADITKMYRQIKISSKQINYQRILWRNNKHEPLQHFRLKTLTYGTKPASFIATRCIQQLADDNNLMFPDACEVIRRDFYMDDLLTGCNTLEGAIQLRHDVTQILAQGKFRLRKWSSNDPRTLLDIEDRSPNAVVELESSADMKVLGVSWDCTQDVFKYRVKLQEVPTAGAVTKRSILSALAQMFDPLGYLSPIIIRGKVLIQQLWANKLGWDDTVPNNVFTTWSEILNEIHHIREIKIPRYVLSNFSASTVEIHGFSDSSEQAYGAVLYLRVTNEHGDISVNLLCAKSRVAPLKTVSIPRLELCGALLLSRLFDKAITSLNISFHRRVMWTDSTIVLAWLKSTSNTLKTFVANRVTEINDLTANCEWRHINSQANPADIISRGLSPRDILRNKLWWSGPVWLSEDSSRWPHFNNELNEIDIPEKRTVNLVASVRELSVFSKYSSFATLRRVIAYCLRFIFNCKSKVERRNNHLSTIELRDAAKAIFKAIQAYEFESEIANLTKGVIKNKGKLTTLDPFLDSDGILRVGGRLRNAGISYDKTHPIILPKGHHVTKLLIIREHERQLHAGAQATLASLRQNYWIISGRSAVRQVIFKCIKCFKAKPTAITQKMGDLPHHRLEPLRPFFKTGVDFAGPILIKESKGRGKRKMKAYISVFICFATKAIHLELVGDLSAESFLNALRRLTARRGHVAHLFSDNATNFTGANHILSKLKNSSSSEFDELNTEFHFIPPRSPNFGGLWEAAVRSVKKHLIRVIGDACLTYEEMYTLLARVEACLNSRPLTPLSSDPNDLSVLTPGHFLIGDALTAIPEVDVTDINVNRLSRWQRVEQLRQHFWRRWAKEYIAQLQGRSKWHQNSRTELNEGALVLIMEDNLPPLQWPMGRIQKLFFGKDDIARVAVLKTCRGEVTRNVRKLCLMPVE